jgi:hypothetical protein
VVKQNKQNVAKQWNVENIQIGYATFDEYDKNYDVRTF